MVPRPWAVGSKSGVIGCYQIDLQTQDEGAVLILMALKIGLFFSEDAVFLRLSYERPFPLVWR